MAIVWQELSVNTRAAEKQEGTATGSLENAPVPLSYDWVPEYRFVKCSFYSFLVVSLPAAVWKTNKRSTYCTVFIFSLLATFNRRLCIHLGKHAVSNLKVVPIHSTAVILLQINSSLHFLCNSQLNVVSVDQPSRHALSAQFTAPIDSHSMDNL